MFANQLYSVNVMKLALVLEDGDFLRFCAHKPLHMQRELNVALQKMYAQQKDSPYGTAYIFCAAKGTGKTHAAVELLLRFSKKSINRGRLIGLSLIGGRMSIREKTAKILGLPSMDDAVVTRWFLALNGKGFSLGTPITFSQKMVQGYKFMVGLWKACTGNTAPEEPQNQQGQYPPVVFLDGVEINDPDDIPFIETFVDDASKHRVLLVLTTSSDTVADTICKQLKTYINALPGARLEDDSWSLFHWTRKDLTELLLHEGSPLRDKLMSHKQATGQFFDDEDMITFVEEGMLPDTARKAAEAALRGALDPILSGGTNLDLTPSSAEEQKSGKFF
jgi:hypothetical protein